MYRRLIGRLLDLPMDNVISHSCTHSTHIYQFCTKNHDLKSRFLVQKIECVYFMYKWVWNKVFPLTIIRPDLTFIIHKPSQCISDQPRPHLKAAYRILQYIKEVPRQGLFFSVNSSLHIKYFVDFNWESYPDSWRSVTRYCTSKKQRTVFRSFNQGKV